MYLCNIINKNKKMGNIKRHKDKKRYLYISSTSSTYCIDDILKIYVDTDPQLSSDYKYKIIFKSDPNGWSRVSKKVYNKILNMMRANKELETI